ncbi:MAG TPA: hypothetical protein PK299_06620 [Anaerolineales bacterium]|nr:hypothetical protein [Anaerolineales bacterium]
MTSYVFQCPACGAPVTPKGSTAVLSCPYCQAAIVVPVELRQTATHANWSTLVYDGFVSNHNEWVVDNQTSEFFKPLTRIIAEGRYRWDAKVGKASSISTVWLNAYPVTDFHLMANGKHIRGSRAGSSWGVAFRIQNNRNYYFFRMTDDRFFSVMLNENGQWITLIAWGTTNTIKPNGVNQLEVIGRKNQFTFLINGQTVGQMEDECFTSGRVGVAVEGYTVGEEISYDFLDFTLRAP